MNGKQREIPAGTVRKKKATRNGIKDEGHAFFSCRDLQRLRQI
jgi:hypothetical protein